MVPDRRAGCRRPRRLGRAGDAGLGSNSVSFEGVALPESGVRGGFLAGDPMPYIERNLLAGCSTPRRRWDRRVGRRASHAAASPGASTAMRDSACRWPTTPSISPPRGASLSRAAALIDEHRAANPASDGTAEELTRAVRRGAGGEGVRQRGGRPRRRPRARPLGRRRLPERQPAGTRVPRRQGGLVHAPARRQPRVRLPRARRARRTGVAALTWRSPLDRSRRGAGHARVPRRARPVRDRRRPGHGGARRRAGRPHRQLAHVRLARAAADPVLPVAQLGHVVADAARRTLRRQRAGARTSRHSSRRRRRRDPTASRASRGRPAVAAHRCSPTRSRRSSARSSASIPAATTGSSSGASTTFTSRRPGTRSSSSRAASTACRTADGAERGVSSPTAR